MRKIPKISVLRRFRDLLSQDPNFWAQSPNPQTRLSASRHPDISERSLILLAKDPDRFIRYGAASHPNLKSKKVLIEIACDDDSLVRAHLTTRKDLPIEAVEILVEDPMDNVREQLACSPSFLPGNVVRRLASDSQSLIKDYLIKRMLGPATPEYWTHPDISVVLDLIEHQASREGAISLRSNLWEAHSSDRIPKLIAILTTKARQGPRPDKETMARLLSHPDKSIRLAGMTLVRKTHPPPTPSPSINKNACHSRKPCFTLLISAPKYNRAWPTPL